MQYGLQGEWRNECTVTIMKHSRNLHSFVVLGGLLVIVIAIEPKVRGFKPDRGRWIFKGDKTSSTTSFGGEVRPAVPRRKILRHVKRHPTVWKRCLSAKFTDNSRQVFPALLLGVPAGYYQRSLVSESGIVITQMGKKNRSIMVAVHGMPCAISPRIQ
jgi:hypothetical protein